MATRLLEDEAEAALAAGPAAAIEAADADDGIDLAEESVAAFARALHDEIEARTALVMLLGEMLENESAGLSKASERASRCDDFLEEVKTLRSGGALSAEAVVGEKRRADEEDNVGGGKRQKGDDGGGGGGGGGGWNPIPRY